jgi:hypothetical protein
MLILEDQLRVPLVQLVHTQYLQLVRLPVWLVQLERIHPHPQLVVLLCVLNVRREHILAVWELQIGLIVQIVILERSHKVELLHVHYVLLAHIQRVAPP